MKTKSKTIEDKFNQTLRIIRLQKQRLRDYENELNSFPMRLWIILMDILQDKKSFHYPDLNDLRVFDEKFEEFVTLSIKADEVVCIQAIPKSRKKRIYIEHILNNKQSEIRTYLLNNNELNFNKLINYLDPLNHHLVIVSKYAIANVKYYDKMKSNKLQLSYSFAFPKEIKFIDLSDKIGFEDFVKVKGLYQYQISLQKRLFDYKNRNSIK